MLKIRAGQMQGLDEAAAAAFHRRLREFVRSEIPDATAALSDEALTKHLVEAEQRARKLGVQSEAGIAQFACLTFVAEPHFDELPAVQEYLAQSTPGPEDKLDALVRFLAAREQNPDADPLDVLLG